MSQHPPSLDEDLILSVRDLQISFDTDQGLIRAVDGIDYAVRRGRTLGIVGESGSGKSVATRALMRLLPKTARIDQASMMLFRRADGCTVDIAGLAANGDEVRRIRGSEIAMIFQEPMASFSPVYTVGNQMTEAIRLHRGVGVSEARAIAVEMLNKVGISNAGLRIDQYPHELSGGMRQRAMIAAALTTSPSLLIADEPTTALDVTIQAQILALMRDLQRDFEMSIIFISHDMAVIAQVADEIAVMYLGRIVERGPTEQVIYDPQHPYTQGLLRAIPKLGEFTRRLTPIGGDIPSPLERPRGCPFHTRCASFIPARCDAELPPDVRRGGGRTVSCFLHV